MISRPGIYIYIYIIAQCVYNSMQQHRFWAIACICNQHYSSYNIGRCKVTTLSTIESKRGESLCTKLGATWLIMEGMYLHPSHLTTRALNYITHLNLHPIVKLVRVEWMFRLLTFLRKLDMFSQFIWSQCCYAHSCQWQSNYININMNIKVFMG